MVSDEGRQHDGRSLPTRRDVLRVGCSLPFVGLSMCVESGTVRNGSKSRQGRVDQSSSAPENTALRVIDFIHDIHRPQNRRNPGHVPVLDASHDAVETGMVISQSQLGMPGAVHWDLHDPAAFQRWKADLPARMKRLGVGDDMLVLADAEKFEPYDGPLEEAWFTELSNHLPRFVWYPFNQNRESAQLLRAITQRPYWQRQQYACVLCYLNGEKHHKPRVIRNRAERLVTNRLEPMRQNQSLPVLAHLGIHRGHLYHLDHDQLEAYTRPFVEARAHVSYWDVPRNQAAALAWGRNVAMPLIDRLAG